LLDGWEFIFGGAIAFFIWLLRLEGKVNKHASDLAKVERQVEKDRDEVKDALKRIDEKLDRVIERQMK
jgi:hypothetical protein